MLDTKLVDKVISIHASEDISGNLGFFLFLSFSLSLLYGDLTNCFLLLISEEKHPEVVQELSAILDMYESMCRQTYEIVGE